MYIESVQKSGNNLISNTWFNFNTYHNFNTCHTFRLFSSTPNTFSNVNNTSVSTSTGTNDQTNLLSHIGGGVKYLNITQSGLEQIRQIKTGMNSGRKYLKE